MDVHTPVSCTEDGLATFSASVTAGSRTFTDEQTKVLPATGHPFTDHVYQENATCTLNGTEVAVCGNGCGETDTREAPGTATGEPDTPAGPTDPGTPSGNNICKWDNVDHGTSFWGRIVRFFHSVLYFFARLFGRR